MANGGDFSHSVDTAHGAPPQTPPPQPRYRINQPLRKGLVLVMFVSLKHCLLPHPMVYIVLISIRSIHLAILSTYDLEKQPNGLGATKENARGRPKPSNTSKDGAIKAGPLHPL